MKDRPILFSGEMVRAILNERKTQTRRIASDVIKCPYGKPGDRLWVKETFALPDNWEGDPTDEIDYRADLKGTAAHRWRPSIFMPRWASRITLEITGVRVEHLQDISESDAKAEGVQKSWSDDQGETPGRWLYHTGADNPLRGHSSAADAYKVLWESINGKGSWEKNPWVWVITFQKV